MARRTPQRLLISTAVICVLAVGGLLALKRSSLAGPGQERQGKLFFGLRDVVFGLSGMPVTTPITDWSFVDTTPTIQIETHPWWLIPYSVTIWNARVGDQLYLYAEIKAPLPGQPDLRDRFPEVRNWNKNLMRDPRIRVKIGDRLITGTAKPVPEPPGVEPDVSLDGTTEYERARRAFYDKYAGVRRNIAKSPGERDKMHFFRVTPQYQ